MGLRPPLAGTITLGGQAMHRHDAPREILRAGRRLRARGPQRRRPGQGVLRRREPGARPVRPAAVRQPVRGSTRTRSPSRRKRAGRAVRHPHLVARVSRSARCPAATSRRSSWRGRCPGRCKLFIAAQPTRGVDVGSIEFIHRPDHRTSATSAPPCWWSPASWTRWWRWPTGSRSCTAAGSSPIVSPDTPARGDRPADGRHHRTPPARRAPEPHRHRPRRAAARRGAGASGDRTDARRGRRAGDDGRRSTASTASEPGRHGRRTTTPAGRGASPATASVVAPSRASREATPSGQFLHNLWTANTVTVTVLADRAGAGHRRDADHHLRPQRAGSTYTYFFAQPGRRAHRELGRGQRRVRQPVQGLDRRPGGGPGRVERQPAPGSGSSSRSRRRSPTPRRWSSPVSRSRWRSAAACSTSASRARRSWARSAPRWPASCCRCRSALHLLVALLAGLRRRRVLGLHPRHPQGAHRRPRGHHHDHAQLRRAALPELAHPPERRAGPGPHRRDQQGGRRLGAAAAAARPRPAAGQPRHRAGGAGHLRRSPGCCNRSTFGFELRAVGAQPGRRAHGRHQRRRDVRPA